MITVACANTTCFGFSHQIKLVDFPDHWKRMNADSQLQFAAVYEVSYMCVRACMCACVHACVHGWIISE